MYTIYQFFMIWGFDFLNQVGRTPGLLKLFSEKCVCVLCVCVCVLCVYVCVCVCVRHQPIMLLILPIMLCCNAQNIYLLCS